MIEKKTSERKKPEKTLLIVEDDQGLQTQLKWHFSGHEVISADDREQAIAALRMYEPQVVLQDLGLPPDEDGVSEGFRCMEEILELKPDAKVIVITGAEDTDNAIRAVSKGAYDFYQKPIRTEILDLIVSRAFQMARLEEGIRKARDTISSDIGGLITSNPAMISVCRKVEKIAKSDVTCLLLGESGTGKELLARAVHDLSERKKAPFIPINCAAIPESLIENELFGHERGAFTGADKLVQGKFEVAQKGTIFLDELGDMPLAAQSRLLRFLQERTIERVGGREEIVLDVRVVCATNKDLEQMVQNGEFREDLYYRVSELEVLIPPLRERGGDKILLARHFLGFFSSGNDRDVLDFSEDAIAAIDAYTWPGNVRELENKVKQAIVLGEGKMISSKDLGLRDDKSLQLNLRQVREAAEKQAINQSLIVASGNVSSAAKMLGISRPTLYDLMKKWNIKYEQIKDEVS